MLEFKPKKVFERLKEFFSQGEHPILTLHKDVIAHWRNLELEADIMFPPLDTFTTVNSFEITWGFSILLGLVLLQFLLSLKVVRNLIVVEGSVEEDLLKRIFSWLLAITTLTGLVWSLDCSLYLWELQQQPYTPTFFQGLFGVDLCWNVTVELVFMGFFFLGLLSHLTLQRFEEKRLPLWSLLWVRSLAVFMPFLFIILCIKNLVISYLLFQVYIGWVYNLNGLFDWMGLKSDFQEFYYQSKIPAFANHLFEYLFLLSFSSAVFFFGYLLYYYGVHTYDQGLHVVLPADERTFLGKFLILNMHITTLVIPLFITLRFFDKTFLPTVYFLVLGPVQVGSLIIFCFTSYLLHLQILINTILLCYTGTIFWGVGVICWYWSEDQRISILTIGLLGQWAVMLFLTYVWGFRFGWTFLFFCLTRLVMVYVGTLYYWQHHLCTPPSIKLLRSYFVLQERAKMPSFLTLYMLYHMRFMLTQQPFMFTFLKLLITTLSEPSMPAPWIVFLIYLVVAITDLCIMYFVFLTALFFLEDKFYRKKFWFTAFEWVQYFLLICFLFSVFPT